MIAPGRVRHTDVTGGFCVLFQAEREGIESELQHLFELADAFGSIADKAEIEILSRPGGACETQFHRYTAFQEISVDYSAFDGLFEHAADRKERDPSPHALLVEALLACYTSENLLKTLCSLCAHARACA